MENTKRKSGEYKVKLDGVWKTAKWNAEEEYWTIDDNEDDCLTDNYFDEIGELISD